MPENRGSVSRFGLDLVRMHWIPAPSLKIGAWQYGSRRAPMLTNHPRRFHTGVLRTIQPGRRMKRSITSAGVAVHNLGQNALTGDTAIVARDLGETGCQDTVSAPADPCI